MLLLLLRIRAASALLQSIPQELLKLASSDDNSTEEGWDVLLLKACLDTCPHVRAEAVKATTTAVPLLAANSATRSWVRQQLISAAPQPEQHAAAAGKASTVLLFTAFESTLLRADNSAEQLRVSVAAWGCYMALAPSDMLCSSSLKQAYATHSREANTLGKHSDSSVRLAVAEAYAMMSRYCLSAVVEKHQPGLAKFAIQFWV
jgi:hypothetical protein